MCGLFLFLLLFVFFVCGVVCFFFFSSRRRHTRLVSDWSSDVCSSDLFRHLPVSALRGASMRIARLCMRLISWILRSHRCCGVSHSEESSPERALMRRFRSEERRVGKEGRDGGSAGHLEKKKRGHRNNE